MLTNEIKTVFHENKEIFRRELAERKIVLRAKPLYLGVVLTTRCNLRCVFCTRVKKKGDLPSDLLRKIKPLFPYLAELVWQGGEVFVVSNFKEMFIEAARHPNIRQTIFTSGPLIDHEWAELFARSNTHVAFSIDSAVKETYERLRVGATWERTVAALNYVKEACHAAGRRPDMSLMSVITGINYREVSLLLPFALEHGFTSLTLHPEVPIHEDHNFLNPKKTAANRNEWLWLANAIHAMEKDAARAGLPFYDRVNTIVQQSLPSAGREEPADAAASRDGSHESPVPVYQSPHWDCYMPWQGLFIHGEVNNGDIFPECMCTTTPLGNIWSDDPLDVWNNGAMQEYRRRILQKNIAGFCNPACVSGSLNPLQHSKKDLISI